MAKLIHNLPIPDLDDKTFEELFNEARARIPLYSPDWTDHNLSDPGITFIDLFAWLAEMQIYSLNLLPDRNYLKFLELLDEKPKPAVPAKVDITFTTSENEIQKIPKHTKVVTNAKAGSEEVAFETDEELEIIPATLQKIVSFADLKYTDYTEANKKVGIFYHAFGERAQEGSVLYLGFKSKGTVAGKFTIMVSLYEADLPARGQHGEELPQFCVPVELAREYWQGSQWTSYPDEIAKRMQDGTVLFTQSGGLSINIPSDIDWQEHMLPPFLEDEYNCFWMRCKAERADYEIPPRIDTMKLNTISATQGQRKKGETLTRKERQTRFALADKEESSGLPGQVFQSQRHPIISGTQYVTVQEPGGEPNKWLSVDNFDHSGPEDNHYILYPDEGEIIFGDGVNGRIPPKESRIKLDYRFGGGEVGNISAGTAWEPLRIEDKIVEMKNERPGAGGTEAESVEAPQMRIRRDLKVPYRAVTAKDYEIIAKNTPGLRVARAYAVASPKKNMVTVTVVPYSPLERPEPSREFLDAVCRHLDMHRLLTTNLSVVKPEYVRVSVEATVRLKPLNDPEAMRDRIEKALSDFLDPLKGGPDKSGWAFGRSVYRSEVYAVIEAVDGVDCVTQLVLRAADGSYQYKQGNIDIPSLYLVYPGSHTIEIRTPEGICKDRAGNTK